MEIFYFQQKLKNWNILAKPQNISILKCCHCATWDLWLDVSSAHSPFIQFFLIKLHSPWCTMFSPLGDSSTWLRRTMGDIAQMVSLPRRIDEDTRHCGSISKLKYFAFQLKCFSSGFFGLSTKNFEVFCRKYFAEKSNIPFKKKKFNGKLWTTPIVDFNGLFYTTGLQG